MLNEAKHILKNHQLRSTECRRQVMQVLLLQEHAISQPELEKQLQQFDRVTLYRTLNTFMQKGIVHHIIDGTGATKYALCSDDCSEHQHDDEHLHFSCVKCGTTQCIDTISIPKISLPETYQVHSIHFLAKGVCKLCVEKVEN